MASTPDATTATATAPAEQGLVLTPPDPDRPKRGGWWNRLAGRG